MPVCGHCESSSHVHVHGYRGDHIGRRITGVDRHYFMLTRRYVCMRCRPNAINAQQQQPYTFSGWKATAVQLLPYGHGDCFPAFLTHRHGVDKRVIDMMRPLFNKGVRPEAFSDLLLELHTKQYTHDYIRREQLLAKQRASIVASMNASSSAPQMFSAFSDKYDGRVPTGKYIMSVYKAHAASISDHLDKEVRYCPCLRALAATALTSSSPLRR